MKEKLKKEIEKTGETLDLENLFTEENLRRLSCNIEQTICNCDLEKYPCKERVE